MKLSPCCFVGIQEEAKARIGYKKTPIFLAKISQLHVSKNPTNDDIMHKIPYMKVSRVRPL